MPVQRRRHGVMWMMIVIIVSGVSGCSGMIGGQDDVLIGLTNDAAQFILQPQQTNPVTTGLPSLDALNRTWRVQRMTPAFPDVSPNDAAALRSGLAGVYKLAVPRGTNLRGMIREYQSDPNVAYAEINTPAETK